jgi:hypothetical protein
MPRFVLLLLLCSLRLAGCRNATELELSTELVLAGGPAGADAISEAIRRFLSHAEVHAGLRHATAVMPIKRWTLRAKETGGSVDLVLHSRSFVPSYSCSGGVTASAVNVEACQFNK